MDAVELEKRLHELLREQFNLRMMRSTDQLGQPSQFKAVRRDIARIKTLMGERAAAKKAGADR
jgi:large subunit ribosomal protein L29